MSSNVAEGNSSALGSSFSRQNAGFTNVPFDDGSRRFQVEGTLMVGNGTEHSLAQDFVPGYSLPCPSSELVPPNDGSRLVQVEGTSMVGNGTGHSIDQGFVPGSDRAHLLYDLVPFDDGNRRLEVEGTLMVGNGTGHSVAQYFVPGSSLPCPSSELAPQLPSHGSQQYLYSSGYMEGNGTTRLNHAQQAFGSGSGGGTSISEQCLGTGLLQDICTPTAAPNQPGKRRKAKNNAESCKAYRERRKARQREILEELKTELEMLRKENKKLITDLDHKNRDVDALGGKVQQLKYSHAECWEMFKRQQIQTQHLTKLLENMLSLPGENARLQGENASLQGENARLQGKVTRLQGKVTRLQGKVTRLQGKTPRNRPIA